MFVKLNLKKQKIDSELINEIENKMSRLVIPCGYSIRLVLIHINGVNQEVLDSSFFSEIIDFSKILK